MAEPATPAVEAVELGSFSIRNPKPKGAVGGGEGDAGPDDGNAAKGAKLFKGKCAQCHTINKGGNAKQGPPLWGVMGRASGSVDGFAYSDANKNSGIVWSDKHMYQYLVAPTKYIVGTKMVFRGAQEGEGARERDLA